jgi:hypothetical protein
MRAVISSSARPRRDVAEVNGGDERAVILGDDLFPHEDVAGKWKPSSARATSERDHEDEGDDDHARRVPWPSRCE